MKKTLMTIVLAAMAAGCLPESDIASLSPFYAPDNLVTDDSLVGKWGLINNDDDKVVALWTFNKKGDEGYGLRVIVGEANYKFEVHHFEMEGTRFMDIAPMKETLEARNEDFAEKYYLPVHCLMKIAQTDPNLQLCNLDDDAVEEFLKTNPDLFDFKNIENRIVLTGSEKQIRQFPAVCVKEDLLDSPWTLIRLEPQYEEQDIVFDESLIGVWPFDNDVHVCDIKMMKENQTAYDMTFLDDDDKEARMYANLVCRNGVMLLAAFYDKSDLAQDQTYPFNLIPDVFFTILYSGGTLELEPLSYEDASALLAFGPDALPDTD